MSNVIGINPYANIQEYIDALPLKDRLAESDTNKKNLYFQLYDDMYVDYKFDNIYRKETVTYTPFRGEPKFSPLINPYFQTKGSVRNFTDTDLGIYNPEINLEEISTSEKKNVIPVKIISNIGFIFNIWYFKLEDDNHILLFPFKIKDMLGSISGFYCRNVNILNSIMIFYNEYLTNNIFCTAYFYMDGKKYRKDNLYFDYDQDTYDSILNFISYNNKPNDFIEYKDDDYLRPIILHDNKIQVVQYESTYPDLELINIEYSEDRDERAINSKNCAHFAPIIKVK